MIHRMAKPVEPQEVGRTMGRLEQLLDQVETVVREMRVEIDRQRDDPQGDAG